ncbi:MAG: flagellar hook-length control protein FliK [Paraglaciecola sp.]|jgi:flagellar hook-length control protein FliK
MMQHVATAKSEVAAFATGAGSNSFTDPQSNEQFGKLLQDQKSQHSLAAPSLTLNKKAPQPSNDVIREPKMGQTKSISNEHSETFDAQRTSSQTGKTASQTTIEGNDELKVADTKADSLLDLSSKPDDLESDVESTDIVAQEWVLLVDNLQKLADMAQLTKLPSQDVEGQPLADLTLSSIAAKSLLEPITEGQIVDKLKLAKDEDLSQPIEDNILATKSVQSGQVQVDDAVVAKKQTEQSISVLVNKALDEVLATAERAGLANIDVKQKTLDTTIDKVIIKDSLLAEQQIETGAPVDVTLAQPVLSDTPDKLVQAQQVETLITKLESGAESEALLEQDIQIAQVASSNVLSSNKTEKVTSNVDIKNILNLTDNKLDKVLENIAQRVFDSKKTVEPITPEQIAQQMVIPKAAEIISTVDSSSKEFISAIKSGLEEFKNQLSQGREPGIDLKALISDALAKISDKEAVAKTPANLEQMVKSVTQVLDFAQTMNRTIEHHHDQSFSAASRDVAQIQGEQSKQIQLNQFESKFDKAINIAKPEGHQQLAEKVRWMVNTKNLVAEIRLDPAELGSVHVKVALSGESATINFVVQSQQARDALDTATPKLREMLAEKGIELGQSSVRQESDGQQSQGDGQSASQGSRSKDEVENVEVPEQVFTQQKIVNGALGGIDYFV